MVGGMTRVLFARLRESYKLDSRRMNPTGYNLMLALLFAGAAAAGVWLLRWKRDWPVLDRFLAGLAMAGVLVLAGICVGGVLRAPFFGWNGARLAPTFALVNGYRLYYPDGAGPVLNTIYGPVTALAYLPATLAPSPTGALLIASVMSLLLTLAPPAWLMMRTGRWGVGGAALLCFGLLAMHSYPVKYAAFCVHADAPALGLAGLACAAVCLRRNAAEWKWLGASAALAVLSVWAKQTMALMPVALAVGVWWLFGAASVKRYLLALGIAGAAVTIVCVSVFGWEPLFFNLVKVPTHHPWQGDRIGCLLQAVEEMAVASVCPLAIIVIGFLVRRRWGSPVGRWPLFAMVGAANAPAALLNLVKAGGDLNALSVLVYFWLLAAVLLLVETAMAECHRLAGVAKVALAVLLAGLLVGTPVRLGKLPSVWRSLANNQQERACRILRENPGRLYFPDNPLAHLMAEHRLYHLSYGLIDRKLGGFPVSDRQFRAHLPPAMNTVVFGSLCAPADKETQETVLRYLPDWAFRGKDAFGWTIYTRANTTTTPTNNVAAPARVW
jgi:hypothetical protein